MENPTPTLDERLAAIEAKLEKIDRAVNPPVWRIILGWVIRNFWTIVLLVTVLWLAWEAWQLFQEINAKLEAIRSIPANAQDSAVNFLDKLKFWEK